ELGYAGGETILKEYVREIRPRPARRPALRFETAQGVQGQVDLSPYELELGGVLTSVVCFSFVLAWSRWRFFYFVLHADCFTVMLCHRLAFEELGGVPSEILYDRMKQVVIAVVDGEPVLQDDFARLVNHYDFRVRVLESGYKEGKGKVEKPFQDVETFLDHHTFHSLDDLNAQAFAWRRDELHVTPHRTTDERPCDRLLSERPFLSDLPDHPFRCEQRQRAQTGKHFHVEYRGRFYSVPPQFADRWVTRCLLNGRLWVEVDGEVISEHELRDDDPKFVTLPEHEAAFREMGARRKGTRKAFVSMGPAAERFAQGLDRAQGGASTYHMAQILKLVTRIGHKRVLDALRYATGYEAFNHTAVLRIARARRIGGTASIGEAAIEPPSDAHRPPRTPDSQAPLDDGEPSGQDVQRSLDRYAALIREKSKASAEREDEHGK
ncbi:MAG: IS21 family transposase, partial [Armatimonadetes bacterium]|nr:IS21 family transposase [Armatimonadota bacterium]